MRTRRTPPRTGRTPQQSRREFLAAASAISVASAIPLAVGNTQSSRLALHGGEKAVDAQQKRPKRWGNPERARLNAMLDQDSLFYWNGPQTNLLIERFKTACPVKYVMPCSSGSAAVHIAVAAAGVGPGDEVITTSVTDIGSMIGILYQQAVPIFADLVRAPIIWIRETFGAASRRRPRRSWPFTCVATPAS